MERAFRTEFLRSDGLRPHHFVPELGLGTLRNAIPVIELLDPGHFYGLEARAFLLDEARAMLRAHGLVHKAPRLYVPREYAEPELDLDRRFDVVRAFSVLPHLHDEFLDPNLAFVARHLAEAGAAYANANLGAETVERRRGRVVVRRSRAFYQELAARHGLVAEVVGTLGGLGPNVEGHGADQSLLRFTRSP